MAEWKHISEATVEALHELGFHELAGEIGKRTPELAPDAPPRLHVARFGLPTSEMRTPTDRVFRGKVDNPSFSALPETVVGEGFPEVVDT